MIRPNLRWWMAGLIATLLVGSAQVEARQWIVNGERRANLKGLDSGAAAKARADTYLGRARTQMGLYKASGNAKQQEWARANLVRGARAKVDMWRAQLKDVRTQEKAARAAGQTAQADQLKAQGDKLSGRIQKVKAGIAKYSEKHGIVTGRTKGPGSKMDSPADVDPDSTPGAGTGTRDQGPQKTAAVEQEDDPTETAPGLDGSQVTRQTSLGSSSAGRVDLKRAKGQAMAQISNGNYFGALDTLKRMEAQDNRPWYRGGLVDRFRKWSTRRNLEKQTYRTGKEAARIGDFAKAQEALVVVNALGKGKGHIGDAENGGLDAKNRKVNGIGKAAVKGAKDMAKSHRPEEAFAMLDFARQIQMAQGRQEGTRQFRSVRKLAEGRLWKDLRARAKEGDFLAFRSAMRLANAYSQERGDAHMKPGQLKEIRKLYMVAMERSVVRAVKDAELLMSGKLGYVSLEEAGRRLQYAEQTAEKLAARGIKVKTGMFSSGIPYKVRQKFIKMVQEQNRVHRPKPGFMRRLYERWAKQPHMRTQPTVANVETLQETTMREKQERMAAQMQNQGMMGPDVVTPDMDDVGPEENPGAQTQAP